MIICLGDDNESTAILLKIQEDTNQRKEEITAGKEEYLELYGKAGQEMDKAFGSFGWKGVGYSDVAEKIKGKIGGFSDFGGFDENDDPKTSGASAGSVGSGITSGGPRAITINIEKEMIGQVAINSYNVRDGVMDIEEMLEEMLRRLLMSVTSS